MTPEEQAASESSSGEVKEQSYLQQQGEQQAESLTATDANATVSSTEETGEEKPAEPKTALEVVNKVMDEMQEGESPTPKPGEEGQKETESKADAEDEEGEKKPPFHEHPRWQEMLAQNQTLKERVQEFEEGEIGKKAENYQQLNEFLQSSNLDAKDFNNGIEIMSAMKNDPVRALEMIKPYYDALLHANGHVLPDDLKQRLDDGVIDEETAYAMSVDRARNHNLQQQLQRHQQTLSQQQQQTQEQQQIQQQTAIVNSMKEAVVKWEQNWQSDPDYSKLQPFVRDKFAVASQANPPRTPEEAVALAEQVKKEVVEGMSSMMPTKKPITNLSSTGRNTNSQPTAKPETSMDVVEQALARG